MKTAPALRRELLATPLSSGLLYVARSQGTQPRLRELASFSILADMLGEVGGSAVEVTALVEPSVDSHVFEASPADVQRVAKADLMVINGQGFERWIERRIRASGYRGTVVVATQGIAQRKLGSVDDPHAWQSPMLWQRYVENLRAAMVVARPSQAAAIDARAAYDTRRIERMYQSVRAQFVENISDPCLLERIAREAGTCGGGTLYSDVLSPPGSAGDTHLRTFEHDVATLLAALRSDKP